MPGNRVTSNSYGVTNRGYAGSALGDNLRSPTGDELVDSAVDAKRAGDEFRKLGKYQDAIRKYRMAAELCEDAKTKLDKKSGQELDEQREKLLLAINQMRAMDVFSSQDNGRPDEASRSPSAELQSPKAPTKAKAETSKKSLLDVGVASKVGGFSDPKSNFPYMTVEYGEITDYTERLEAAAHELVKAEREGNNADGRKLAIEKLREAADIMNFIAQGGRWQTYPKFRAEAREFADNYQQQALALMNRSSKACAQADGAGSANEDDEGIAKLVRGCMISGPLEEGIKWDHLVGLDDAQDALLGALIDPYVMAGAGTPKGRGVLLYGPPGTGKTILVKAAVEEKNAVLEALAKLEPTNSDDQTQQVNVNDEAAMDDGATETPAPPGGKKVESGSDNRFKPTTLFMITPADVFSKWVGVGEKFIKALFAEARTRQPAVIFVDEVDAFLRARGDSLSESANKVLIQFLQELQGLGSNGDITVIGATNLPWDLDAAGRRRFDQSVYVGVPEASARPIILKQKLDASGVPYDITQEQIDALALSSMLDKFTGADLDGVVKGAIINGPGKNYHRCRHFVRRGKHLEPCEPDTQGAIHEPYLALVKRGEKFNSQPIKFVHLEKAARTQLPSAKAELWKYEKFNRDNLATK